LAATFRWSCQHAKTFELLLVIITGANWLAPEVSSMMLLPLKGLLGKPFDVA
jgi:hypothetical protein